MHAPTLLLTGFDPFDGERTNPSWLIAQALQDRADVQHVKVEDGSGQRLGRSFGVKLWPTLVFLRDGKEVARTVRPQHANEVQGALQGITA